MKVPAHVKIALCLFLQEMSRQSCSSLEGPASSTGPEATIHPIVSMQLVLHWNDIPPWMQIDPYIRRGYRRQLDSLSACFWSLFYLHNEFVNTWSHLLPALFYLSALIDFEWDLFFYQHRNEPGQVVRREDNVIVQIYAVGTVICLLASVCVYDTYSFAFFSFPLYFTFFCRLHPCS